MSRTFILAIILALIVLPLAVLGQEALLSLSPLMQPLPVDRAPRSQKRCIVLRGFHKGILDGRGLHGRRIGVQVSARRKHEIVLARLIALLVIPFQDIRGHVGEVGRNGPCEGWAERLSLAT